MIHESSNPPLQSLSKARQIIGASPTVARYKALGAMITDERCGRALQYLAQTDSKCADLKTDVARKEYLLDLAKKRVFLTADGGVEERKAIAEVSTDVQTAVEAHLKALLAFERIRAKRATEAMIVDTWRTCSANRRTGNI